MSIKNVSVNIIFITICLQRTEWDLFKYRERRSGRIKKSPEMGGVVCCNLYRECYHTLNEAVESAVEELKQ